MNEKEKVFQMIIDENDLVTKEEYDSIEVDGRSVTEVEYKEIIGKDGKH